MYRIIVVALCFLFVHSVNKINAQHSIWLNSGVSCNYENIIKEPEFGIINEHVYPKFGYDIGSSYRQEFKNSFANISLHYSNFTIKTEYEEKDFKHGDYEKLYFGYKLHYLSAPFTLNYRIVFPKHIYTFIGVYFDYLIDANGMIGIQNLNVPNDSIWLYPQTRKDVSKFTFGFLLGFRSNTFMFKEFKYNFGCVYRHGLTGTMGIDYQEWVAFKVFLEVCPFKKKKQSI